MKTKLGLIFLITAILNLTSVTFVVFAEDKAAGGAFDAAAMEKWKINAAPNENHKVLDSFVGKWKTTSRMWMNPGEAPTESTGTAKNEWVMGGRFLKQDFKGEAMGQPFEGTGFTGYDNMKKEYNSVWIDSMGTGIMTSSGKYDSASKTITEKGSFVCPMTEKETKYRSEWKSIDANNFTFSMYDKGKDGKEFKNMEILYTRK